MRRAVRSASIAWLVVAACLDGRGTIVVEGAGGPTPEPDPGDGPGLDLGGDADSDGDPDGFPGADADSDADSDAPAGDADGDSDIVVPGGDADADADGDADVGCVQPQGPFGSREGDTLADFPQALPECGSGDLKTLFSYCEAGAIAIHFNSPG